MEQLRDIHDFQSLLSRLGQTEISGYYDTLKKIADDKKIPAGNRVSAIKEMRIILEKYAKGQDVNIPKFIEVGRKKFEAMESAHAATVEAKGRLDNGESIETILHLGSEAD